jgi:hypothetical protein
MRDVARHECTGAGPPGGGFVADLEGEFTGQHPGDFVAVVVQMIEARRSGGQVSSNIMMLSSVSRPRSFNAKGRPGVGGSKCVPPPAGRTKPFAALILVSSLAAEQSRITETA